METGHPTPRSTPVVVANIGALRGGGSPLPASSRRFFEPRFGVDFDHVRLHTDARAADTASAINAKAFTIGRDIAFAAGQYSPGSAEGQHLLAHELTHVVQQSCAVSPIAQRKQSDTKNADVDPLEDILPKGVGMVAVIDRAVALRDVFGAELDTLVRDVRANAAAKAFTRETGMFGLIALVDTRGPGGFDVPAARKALADDDKIKERSKRRYTLERLELHAERAKSYMFQANPPAQKKPAAPGGIDSATSHLRDVVVDPTKLNVTVAGLSVDMEFSFLGADVDGRGVPTGDALRGRTLVVKAVTRVLTSLDALPPAPNRAVRREDERTRARLKETMRRFASTPLRIFIATSEAEVLTGLAFRTEEVFVRPGDFGDPSKLEAAVRVPLVALMGSSGVGSRVLTADETAEALLHEAVHALLIQRHVSANQLWDKVRGSLVEGPPIVKNRAEEVLHLFLLAQEEIWVYGEVQKLGPDFQAFAPVNVPRYELFVAAVDAFLNAHAVAFDTVKQKIDVTERVDRRKVDWSVTYRHPQKLVVTGSDLTPLNDLVILFRNLP
jgi:hypothetical protein